MGLQAAEPSHERKLNMNIAFLDCLASSNNQP